MQQEPELIGEEAMAAEAVGFEVELEILDPVLALSAPGVELVEILRLVGPRGNDEAGIGPSLHRLGLVDDPAPPLPAPGLVGILREKPRLVTFLFVALFGCGEQVFGLSRSRGLVIRPTV